LPPIGVPIGVPTLVPLFPGVLVPKPLVPVPEPIPPIRFAFAYNCSIRGSYKNSHVSYVVCSFTTSIAEPLFWLPTPMIGPPPPPNVVASWLWIPFEPVDDEPVDPAPVAPVL
jgi:hypothetical protein